MKLSTLESILLGALASTVGATYHGGQMKSEMKYDMSSKPVNKATDGSGSNGYGNAYGNGYGNNNVASPMPMEKTVEPVQVQAQAQAPPGMKLEGAKDNENIMVISQNWGADKGEMVVNAASPGGKVHTVRYPILQSTRNHVLTTVAGHGRWRRTRVHARFDRCGRGRQGDVHVRHEEPHGDAIDLREAVRQDGVGRRRLGLHAEPGRYHDSGAVIHV